jgi:Domain of unknown function (DUF4352)
VTDGLASQYQGGAGQPSTTRLNRSSSWLAVVVGLVLPVVLFGCFYTVIDRTGGVGGIEIAPVGAPGEKAEVAVGETLAVTTSKVNIEYTVIETAQAKADDFDRTPTNGVFLLVHTAVRAKKGEVFACGCDFSFVDAGGKVYKQDSRTIPGKPPFESPDLVAGQNTDGWIVFDVPESVLAGGRVEVRPGVHFGYKDGHLRGYWRL